MDNVKHTPEPFNAAKSRYIFGLGNYIPIYNFEGAAIALVADREGVDNARRIVACVNACAGIDTETLEHIKDVNEIYIRLREENERLRAALDSAGDFIAQIGYSEEYANFRIE